MHLEDDPKGTVHRWDVGGVEAARTTLDVQDAEERRLGSRMAGGKQIRTGTVAARIAIRRDMVNGHAVVEMRCDEHRQDTRARCSWLQWAKKAARGDTRFYSSLFVGRMAARVFGGLPVPFMFDLINV